jgi:MFS family permease
VSREKEIGVASVVGAVVALAFANVIGNEPGEEGDWGLFILFSAVAALIAVLVFGRVIPRARAAPPGVNRPARTGFVVSLLGFLTVAVFWTGLPYVLGAGGALLGRIGEERSRQAGHRGLALAAIVLGVLAIVLAVVVLVTDEAS